MLRHNEQNIFYGYFLMAERRQGREGSYLSTQTALTVQIL